MNAAAPAGVPAPAEQPIGAPGPQSSQAPAQGSGEPAARGRSLPSLARARAACARPAAALRDLAVNLRAALVLAAFGLRGAEAMRASGTQLCLLYLLVLLLGAAYDLYAVGWAAGRLDLSALPAVSFWALAMLASAWLVSAMRARPELLLALATAGFGALCWEAVGAAALALAADASPEMDRWYGTLSWVPPVWIACAYGLGAVRMAQAGTRRLRLAIFVLSALAVLAPQSTVDPASRLWIPESAADSDVEAGPSAPQSEQTLYGQYDLLDDALDSIAPGQAGVAELFTITFGGDGTQDVFLNEAAGADSVMADAFASGAHSLVLANSQAHPQERPFATVSALQRALATVADRMNGDEDVLALFLTSHGTPDHHLVVSLPPYQFEDLTPARLRALLDEAGIRYRVIIVSSCYAGGFVDALAGPDSMVITASGADRTSFGCRDGAQWTDFGRAYFAEALTQTASFEGAFRIASRKIAEREAKEGLTPSQPQISVGAGIRDRLQRVETRRGGRILFASRSGAGTLP